MTQGELKDFLWEKASQYEVPDFIRGAERTTSLIDGKMGAQ